MVGGLGHKSQTPVTTRLRQSGAETIQSLTQNPQRRFGGGQVCQVHSDRATPPPLAPRKAIRITSFLRLPALCFCFFHFTSYSYSTGYSASSPFQTHRDIMAEALVRVLLPPHGRLHRTPASGSGRGVEC